VGDIQFGASEQDSNRYILVQHNWVNGRLTSPKNRKSRRVDMSRQLRAALLELRDQRLLEAYLQGKKSIAGDIVFPSETGTPTPKPQGSPAPNLRRLRYYHQDRTHLGPEKDTPTRRT
jgi:integrase